MRSTFFIFFAILAGLFLGCWSEARAALHVCNGTAEPVSVAIAVQTPNASGTGAQTEGWFQIDSGTCQLVIDSDLDAGGTFYYLFARATSIVWAGSPAKATRDAPFCINNAGRFNYVDRQSNLCSGAGNQVQWFINEPIAGTDWTISLDTPT
jgi:uncharacterized membrane protein